ncbi:hypothetical protein Ddc_18201 [Ditylenchus destructor]|nr:hypothetical protein Ddc_18201 [Ditylenchus destructor]
MRRCARATENLENEPVWELKAKRNRSNDKISNIATLDNGTMVEALKYLGYCQLATNSLVSKRFRDVIQTHRQKLACLHVSFISMDTIQNAPAAIKIFDKMLSPEAYNEWIIRNNFTKQIPLQGQIAQKRQVTQNVPKGYDLSAHAYYNDSNHRDRRDTTTVLFAQAELNDDNWPVFEHFVRLVTDPFIYIEGVRLTFQNDVLNMLSDAVNLDNLIQCKQLLINLDSNSQKFITWTKNHVRCKQIQIYGEARLNQDEALFDFLMTGAQCTSEINVKRYDLSKVFVNFVKKFLRLKSENECHCVQFIEGSDFIEYEYMQVLKKDYPKFINPDSGKLCHWESECGIKKFSTVLQPEFPHKRYRGEGKLPLFLENMLWYQQW